MQIFSAIFYIFCHFLHKSGYFRQFFHKLFLLPGLFWNIFRIAHIARQNEKIVAQAIHELHCLIIATLSDHSALCPTANRTAHMAARHGLIACR